MKAALPILAADLFVIAAGLVTSTAGSIAALAAGTAGAIYLSKKGWAAYQSIHATFHRWDQRFEKLDRIDEEALVMLTSARDWSHGFEFRLQEIEGKLTDLHGDRPSKAA